jgi:hypothetical protein
MSISHLFSIAFNGFIVYKNPSNSNMSMLSQSVSDMMSDETLFSSNTIQERETVDEERETVDEERETVDEISNCKDTLSLDSDDDSIICQICRLNRRNIVIIPCSHSVTCYTCSQKIVKTNNKCPICRSEIKNTIFYFSS